MNIIVTKVIWYAPIWVPIRIATELQPGERGTLAFMDKREQEIRGIIERYIRPRTRVDGGNLTFEKLEGDTLVIGAYGDCATCTCGEKELTEWVGREIARRMGFEPKVRLVRHAPYYAR